MGIICDMNKSIDSITKRFQANRESRKEANKAADKVVQGLRRAANAGRTKPSKRP